MTSSWALLDYVKPRPSDLELKHMVSTYFNHVATKYDSFIDSTELSSYVQHTNQYIADKLSGETPVTKVLSIGAGSGARECSIKQIHSADYAIVVCDSSSEMCQLARGKGLTALTGAWEDILLQKDEIFDACIFLSSFAHLSSRQQRLLSLQKIHAHLRKGGLCFLDISCLDDRNTWGSLIAKKFQDEELEKHGYERGDVFYCMTEMVGDDVKAFGHFSSTEEMNELFGQSGFEIVDRVCFNMQSGQIANDYAKEQCDEMLFCVRKI